ncbi:right-handed parallel beta-helix repeat-containing protein [Roseibacillus ishigakijimensis]|uniref:Right-handed parallel beta-helix repeat-containing protein n=1 Tax=Roseibacillus ishigakijimensis TaxID=454146 RepID=A0A934RQ40_9BACT|nr:right-handed parallel beta-helix repeat-containing protein [Roseibacillus ishigakijimensis]MBK1833034.1 right-handed parallel beta-helix repeat-containing protein [Roseibacillus ishigakijimensis]
MAAQQRLLLFFFLGLLSQPLSALTATVTTAEDQFDFPSGPEVSLREAIRDVGSTGGTVCFSPHLSGATIQVEDSGLSLGSSGGQIVFDGASTNGLPPRIQASEIFAGSSLFSASNRELRFNDLIIDGNQTLSTGINLVGEKLNLIRVEIENFTSIGASIRDGEANFLGCYFHHNAEGCRMNNSAGEIDRCLFAFHSTRSAYIGQLVESHLLRIRNCTFAENRVFGTQGTLALEGENSSSAIIHCSFVDNHGAGYSGPAGILFQGNLFARNSAEGSTGPPTSIVETGIWGATSAGYNLCDDTPASFDHETDQTGPTGVAVSRLGNYGGELMCCFPYQNSRAIEGGIPDRGFPLLTTDIRGFPRKVAANSNGLTNIIDIGAVETNPDGTIEVTNDFPTGAGSFRDAVLAATDETNHIVLKTPITDRTISLLSTVTFSGERNYNIDGSGGNYRLIMNDADEDMIAIGDGLTNGTTVSFDSIEFSGYEANSEIPNRGVMAVDPLCGLSLHQCDITDNTAAVHGVIECQGDLFLNETLFENNNQTSTVGDFGIGGAAIRASSSRITAWNSSFIGNTATVTNMRGGAIRMDSLSRASFRRCTFARNEVRHGGSAIYAEDSAFGSITLELDQCTFAQNEAVDGAVTFEDRMRVHVSGCLFAENRNGSELITRPERRDFHAMEPESVILTTGYPNWTDAPAVFQDFAGPDQRGRILKVAPPYESGGKVPVVRLLEDSEPAITELDQQAGIPVLRDALNRVAFESLFVPNFGSLTYIQPGAVQERVPFADLFEIRSVGDPDNNQIPLSFRGRSGIQWRVETTTDLSFGFTPTDLVVSPNSVITNSVQVPIPTPNPDRFFIRFAEERD